MVAQAALVLTIGMGITIFQINVIIINIFSLSIIIIIIQMMLVWMKITIISIIVINTPKILVDRLIAKSLSMDCCTYGYPRLPFCPRISCR